MTNDYLNEFTPDWPHGHVLVYSDGTAKPFVVKVTNWPGEFPIWGHEAGAALSWRFRADGSSNNTYYRLRNVAPPKREPREVWVNVYHNGYGYAHTSREKADESTIGPYILPCIECIHFREVIEETEAGEEKLPDDFGLAFAKSALHKPREVGDAFYWASTPQGCDFWAGYSVKRLSPEGMALAREALRRWIAIAEKEETK